MSTEANKRQIRRYYEEVLNGRNIALLDQLAVPDYDEHSPFPGQPNGLEGLKARVGAIVAAFHPVFTLHQLVGDGETVVAYWTNTGTHTGEFMGIPPSGRTVTISGADTHRLRDDRMAEHWHVIEELQMLQQLGVIAAPQEAAASSCHAPRPRRPLLVEAKCAGWLTAWRVNWSPPAATYTGTRS